MAYTRGSLYVWTSFYCPDDCPSNDPCPNCVTEDDGFRICHQHTTPLCERPDHEMMHLWTTNEDGFEPLADPDDYGMAAGVGIRGDWFDEIVAMRAAELVDEGLWDETRQRAGDRWGGNAGCAALCHELGLPDLNERLATRYGR